MDKTINFSEFSRQSAKGILIIYLDVLFKFLKASWVLFFILFQKYSNFSSLQLSYFYFSVLGILLFILVRSYLVYRNFQFKLDGDYFVLKKGILSKSNTSISFDRIQNINFNQNLVQQIIGVYGVSIETAGSKNTEIKIKALAYENALALKEKISSNSKTTPVKEQDAETPFLQIGFKELLKVSLTENHFQSLLIFVALLVGLFQQVEQVVETWGQKEFLDTYLDQGKDVLLSNIILVIVLIFFLLIIAVVSSFVRVFLFHFNLTLFFKKEAFEINQGLFNKKSILLKKQKIQSITVSTNPIKKWIGISYITFKQAVSGRVSQKKDKLIRIVGCKVNEVVKLKNKLYSELQIEEQTKEYLNNYYKYRMYFQASILLVILNGLLYLMYQDIQVFLLNLFAIPLFYFIIKIKYNKRFYKVSEDLLLVGSGVVETHHTYFEIFKIQNVKMKQTIFQQRKNVADLVLQTASGKIRIPCLALDKATKLYNYFLYKVETNSNPWM